MGSGPSKSIPPLLCGFCGYVALGGPAGTPLDPACGLLTPTLQKTVHGSGLPFEGRLDGLRKVRENQLAAEPSVETVDQIRHGVQPLGDDADPVLAEVVGLDA